MSFIRQHLKERHLDLTRSRVLVDDSTDQAFFLCFNLLGQLIGVQKYNPFGVKDGTGDPATDRYSPRFSEMHKYCHAWGFETFHYRDDVLFIAEGVFDAIRLHNLGLPAVATLTNAPSREFAAYLSLLGRRIIGICDNDENEAGLRLLRVCPEYFITPAPFKDLGEMPNNLVAEFVNRVWQPIEPNRTARA